MKNQGWLRMVALILCLCMLPFFALAEEESETYWINSLTNLRLHADAFPEQNTRLKDWENYLGQLWLSVRGNAWQLFQPESRAQLTYALGKDFATTGPSVWMDIYNSYHYATSPAFRDEAVFFQMHNFFEFMLKPYFYMGLPTQYIALLMYPEASTYVIDSYYTPLAETLAGEGTRHIPYEDLYELCETLDLLVNDDAGYERVYFYITSLLTEMYAAESTLESLGALEDYLDYLDPEQEGMLITVEGDHETYVLGETTVFEQTKEEGALSFILNLPSEEGYAVSAHYDWRPGEDGSADLSLRFAMSMEEQEAVSIAVEGKGLPTEDDFSSSETQERKGQIKVDLGGEVFSQPVSTQTFDFWLSAGMDEIEDQPHRSAIVSVDWLHPETQKTAFTFYTWFEWMPVEYAFADGAYYTQDDFFNLNESALADYKERYMPSIAATLAPFILEMPAGVIDDIVEFAMQTGILEAFGF